MDQSRKFAWISFFSGIAAFQFHPSNPPKNRISVEECAEIADTMLSEFDKRFPSCPSSSS